MKTDIQTDSWLITQTSVSSAELVERSAVGENDILVSIPFAIPPLHYDGVGRISEAEFKGYDNMDYAQNECVLLGGKVYLGDSRISGTGLFAREMFQPGEKIGTLWGKTVERLTPEYTAAYEAGKLVSCTLTMTQENQKLEFVASPGCACGYINAPSNAESESYVLILHIVIVLLLILFCRNR